MEELYDFGDDYYTWSTNNNNNFIDFYKECCKYIGTKAFPFEFTSIFSECTSDLSSSVMVATLDYDYTPRTFDNLVGIKYTVTASKDNNFAVLDIIEYLSEEDEVMFKLGEVIMNKNQIIRFFNKWLITSLEMLENIN